MQIDYLPKNSRPTGLRQCKHASPHWTVFGVAPSVHLLCYCITIIIVIIIIITKVSNYGGGVAEMLQERCTDSQDSRSYLAEGRS